MLKNPASANFPTRATELFTTALSHLTPAATNVYPSRQPNYSPAPQVTAQFGDLIAPPLANSQANNNIRARIIHRAAQTPGEKVGPAVLGGPSGGIDLNHRAKAIRHGRRFRPWRKPNNFPETPMIAFFGK
jgi:hypothetical protein